MEMEVEQEISNNGQHEEINKEETNGDIETKNGSYSNLNEEHDISNFEDGLKYFDLYSLFKHYEDSLEDVIISQKSQEEHELYFAYFHKNIEKSSVKYHLDLISKKRDTEEMVVVLDTIKLVLNIFNKAFMEELDFQNKLSREFDAILLNKEYKEVSFMCECLYKFCYIKHVYIMPFCFNIREFLTQSQRCVLSFFQNEIDNFNKFQKSAVSHLKNCIEVCQNFLAEYEMIKNEYNFQNIQSISFLMSEIKNDSLRELGILKNLYQIVEYSAKEEFQNFTIAEEEENFFELPFVYYINMMLMCNLMMPDNSDESINFENINQNKVISGNDFFFQMYRLALNYRKHKQHESDEGKVAEKHQMKQEFDILLFQINEKLESSLQIDNYKQSYTKKRFMEKCMKIIDKFYELKCLESVEMRNSELSKSSDEAIKYNYEEKTKNSTDEESIESSEEAIKHNTEDEFKESIVRSEMQKSDFNPSNIKTLEDALKYFDLFSHLNKLSKSLEDVKRNRKTKEDHELLVKKFHKNTQKISLEFHPDKARSKGYSDEKVEEAQKLQVALNATRKILSFLNSVFLTDLDIDHKYEFYFKLNISSLGNEDELEKHIFEVLYKISYISEIKQQITGEIRKFLTQSQLCMKSYIEGEEHSFEKHCHSAVYHLTTCIEKYEKLVEECKAVVEECTMENMEDVCSTVQKIKRESNKQLNTLNDLHAIAKSSLEGEFGVWLDSYPVEEYFVKPFVRYMNLIFLCNLVIKSEHQGFFTRKAKAIASQVERFFFSPSLDRFNQKSDTEYESSFIRACYLALYYSGDKRYKEVAMQIMENETENRKNIKTKFLACVKGMNDILEKEFKIDSYNEIIINRNIKEDLDTCMRMMTSFQEKADKLSKDITDFKRDNQEMKEEIRKKLKECFKEDISSGVENSGI